MKKPNKTQGNIELYETQGRLKCPCSRGKTKHFITNQWALQCENCGRNDLYVVFPE